MYCRPLGEAVIEILLTLILATMLAKHRRKRRYYGRSPKTTAELPLSTLASDTVIVVGLHTAADGAFRMLSVNLTYALVGLTAGNGPITVGLAHSDYTVTEIKQAIESAGAISQGSKIEQEQANRLVRTIGTFGGLDTEALNDGKPIKTRLNWRINVGDVVNLWAYNENNGAMDTGAVVHASGPMHIIDV